MATRTATAVIVKASTIATDGGELTRYYGPFLPHRLVPPRKRSSKT